MNTHKMLSLFAGAGGLDLGLEAAGFETLAANEIEPHACETLRANKLLPNLKPGEFDAWFQQQTEQLCYRKVDPETMQQLRDRIRPDRRRRTYLQQADVVDGDVRELTGKELMRRMGVRRGELTLIAGGPPCQPFSRAGKRESVSVSDGRLFLEFVRLVDQIRPRWFLFENVKGLLLTKTEVIRAECQGCGHRHVPPFDSRDGYETQRAPACPACGSARTSWDAKNEAGGSLHLILAEFARIGYSCEHAVLNAADFGAPQNRERVFIIGSRDGEPIRWPTPRFAASNGNGAASRQLGLFDSAQQMKPWRTMWDSLYANGHPRFGRLDPDSAVLWVKNVVRPHDEPVTWSLDRPSPTIGAHQAAKLAIAPQGVPEEQLWRQQWHTLGRRQGDRPPVPVVHEYLSDAELLELQTFPPHWYLFGTRMQRAFQIGNAVPPILGEAVGRELLRHA